MNFLEHPSEAQVCATEEHEEFLKVDRDLAVLQVRLLVGVGWRNGESGCSLCVFW